MAIPMAIPIMVDFPTLYPNSAVNPFVLNIGPTSGITAAQLHEDTWTVNNQNIFATSNACGSMNTGGNYLDSNGAGVYNFNFTPCLDNAFNYLITGDIATKSLLNQQYTLEFIQPLTTDATLRYEAIGNDVKIHLATDANGDVNTDYITLAGCLNNPSTCTCGLICSRYFEADVFPGINVTNVSKVFPMSKTSLNYIYNSVSNSNVSIGFRCVTPIDYGNYVE
jgi:hypothetical protein